MSKVTKRGSLNDMKQTFHNLVLQNQTHSMSQTILKERSSMPFLGESHELRPGSLSARNSCNHSQNFGIQEIGEAMNQEEEEDFITEKDEEHLEGGDEGSGLF